MVERMLRSTRRKVLGQEYCPLLILPRVFSRITSVTVLMTVSRPTRPNGLTAHRAINTLLPAVRCLSKETALRERILELRRFLGFRRQRTGS